jgi:hypothetical protein
MVDAVSSLSVLSLSFYIPVLSTLSSSGIIISSSLTSCAQIYLPQFMFLHTKMSNFLTRGHGELTQELNMRYRVKERHSLIYS